MRKSRAPPTKLTQVDEILTDHAVEDLPHLSTKDLKDSSILVQDVNGVRGKSIILEDVLSKPVQILRNSAFSIELSWPYGRGRSRQKIGLEWSRLKLGALSWFLCPVTHKSCRTLYFKDGRFASRAGHRIRYATQKMGPGERQIRKDAKFVEKLEGSLKRGPALGAYARRFWTIASTSTLR